jgi:hypothetical protein
MNSNFSSAYLHDGQPGHERVRSTLMPKPKFPPFTSPKHDRVMLPMGAPGDVYCRPPFVDPSVGFDIVGTVEGKSKYGAVATATELAILPLDVMQPSKEALLWWATALQASIHQCRAATVDTRKTAQDESWAASAPGVYRAMDARLDDSLAEWGRQGPSHPAAKQLICAPTLGEVTGPLLVALTAALGPGVGKVLQAVLDSYGQTPLLPAVTAARVQLSPAGAGAWSGQATGPEPEAKTSRGAALPTLAPAPWAAYANHHRSGETRSGSPPRMAPHQLAATLSRVCSIPTFSVCLAVRVLCRSLLNCPALAGFWAAACHPDLLRLWSLAALSPLSFFQRQMAALAMVVDPDFSPFPAGTTLVAPLLLFLEPDERTALLEHATGPGTAQLWAPRRAVGSAYQPTVAALRGSVHGMRSVPAVDLTHFLASEKVEAVPATAVVGTGPGGRAPSDHWRYRLRDDSLRFLSRNLTLWQASFVAFVHALRTLGTQTGSTAFRVQVSAGKWAGQETDLDSLHASVCDLGGFLDSRDGVLSSAGGSGRRRWAASSPVPSLQAVLFALRAPRPLTGGRVRSPVPRSNALGFPLEAPAPAPSSAGACDPEPVPGRDTHASCLREALRWGILEAVCLPPPPGQLTIRGGGHPAVAFHRDVLRARRAVDGIASFCDQQRRRGPLLWDQVFLPEAHVVVGDGSHEDSKETPEQLAAWQQTRAQEVLVDCAVHGLAPSMPWVQEVVKRAQKRPRPYRLDREQELACRAILAHPITMVIGPAGSGKSSIVEALRHGRPEKIPAELWQQHCQATGQPVFGADEGALPPPLVVAEPVHIGVPTLRLKGRYAARQRDCSTLAYMATLLENTPSTMFDGGQTLVIDEMGMVSQRDLEALRLVLASPGSSITRVVMLADAGQLEPVGPGSPFFALMCMPQVHVVELVQDHRSDLPELSELSAHFSALGRLVEPHRDAWRRRCGAEPIGGSSRVHDALAHTRAAYQAIETSMKGYGAHRARPSVWFHQADTMAELVQPLATDHAPTRAMTVQIIAHTNDACARINLALVQALGLQDIYDRFFCKVVQLRVGLKIHIEAKQWCGYPRKTIMFVHAIRRATPRAGAGGVGADFETLDTHASTADVPPLGLGEQMQLLVETWGGPEGGAWCALTAQDISTGSFGVGFACTVSSMQGGQSPHIVVALEASARNSVVYTAITRAERCVGFLHSPVFQRFKGAVGDRPARPKVGVDCHTPRVGFERAFSEAINGKTNPRLTCLAAEIWKRGSPVGRSSGVPSHLESVQESPAPPVVMTQTPRLSITVPLMDLPGPLPTPVVLPPALTLTPSRLRLSAAPPRQQSLFLASSRKPRIGLMRKRQAPDLGIRLFSRTTPEDVPCHTKPRTN